MRACRHDPGRPGRPAGAAVSQRRAAAAAFDDALRQHRAGKAALAERLCRKALAQDPRHAEAHNLLGVLALHRGALAEAMAAIGQALRLHPAHAPYLSNLAAVQQRAGRLAEAVATLRDAVALAPAEATLHFNLGTLLNRLGQPAAAAPSLRAALALQPDHAEAHNNLGNALAALHQPAAAAASYRQALALRPDYAEAHGNLGLAERALGDFAAAAAAFRRALALRPAYPQALNNLGAVLLDQAQPEAAAAAFRQALALRPDHAGTLNNLANALEDLGDAAGALDCRRRAVALDPADAELQLDLCMASLPIAAATVAESQGAAAAFAAALDRLEGWAADPANLARLGRAVGHAWPFYLNYRPGHPRALLARFGTLMHRAALAAWGPRPVAPPPRSRRRIGVVCGFIRRHSVWDVVLRGVVEALDRDRFELFLYHTRPETDAETDWARGQADAFVQGPLPIAAWLDRIGADQPDVLLYAEIGMDGPSAQLAALRLASVQAALWGCPVTSGLPTMDLFFSGAALEAADAAGNYVETLACLPGTGVLTRLPAIPATAPSPARLVLPPPQDAIRFIICQTPYKADPGDDGLFVALAQAVAPSLFWLAQPAQHGWAAARLLERWQAAFAAAGLDPGRVRPLPWLPRDEFLGLLDEMDIYLDHPAFSGFTTAWQALHRGLPIVTLEGPLLHQRLAAGLLRAVDQAETVAGSAADYLALAQRLAAEVRAGDPMARRRAALRAAAPLADGRTEVLRALEDHLLARLAATAPPEPR